MALLSAWGLLLGGPIAAAPLPSESATTEQLPPHPGPHWVWVNDFNFFSMADGRAYLVDGDSGRMLGLISTGYSYNSVLLARNANLIYSPETYYSRGTRGTRTDVVTLYDPAQLQPVGEIAIPPKRSSNIPMAGAAALTDDERFLLIYNFTPGAVRVGHRYERAQIRRRNRYCGLRAGLSDRVAAPSSPSAPTARFF